MLEQVERQVKSIANNIRAARECKNYTQEYVAARLGISQNAYSKIELGYTKITLERLILIGHILDTGISELMCFYADEQREESRVEND
jgi:transcriptional regulator with XRE-family HTH domain